MLVAGGGGGPAPEEIRERIGDTMTRHPMLRALPWIAPAVLLRPPTAGGPGPRRGTTSVQSLMDRRVREAVDAVLAEKGYRRVRPRRADFKVRYFANVRDRVQVQNDVYGWGRFRHNEVSVYKYKEGSLVIDFIDPRLKQIIWRGVGTRSVGDVEKAVREVNVTVSKTLASFPALDGSAAAD